MTDEALIRKLVWQNGLLRGLLAMMSKAITVPMDNEQCVKLEMEVNRVLTAPLPDFLKTDEQPKPGDPDCPF